MKNILIGIEFNEYYETLVDTALEIARPKSAKLWLLHVAAPEPDFVGYSVGPQSVRNNRARELKEEHGSLLHLAEKLRKKKIDAQALLIEGPTIKTIFEEAKKLEIDLIICGHHRHGFLYELIFENTAEEIVQKANIPVLVVPLDIPASVSQELVAT